MTRNVLELDGGARVSGWTFRGKEREQDVKKQQSQLGDAKDQQSV